MSEAEGGNRIMALERELAELRAAAPAHSMPPSLLMRMEELEDELHALLAAELASSDTDTNQ